MSKYRLISRPYTEYFYFRFYKSKSPPLRFSITGWPRGLFHQHATEMVMLDDDNADSNASSAKTSAKKGLSRRAILKAGVAATGAAIGSDVISGFPTIWAQEIKDIELRHVGVSYSVVKAIGDQAAKDLGFKVTMQNLDTSAAINRFISQP